MFEPNEIRRWERQLSAMLEHAAQDDPEGFAVVVRLLDKAVTDGLRNAASVLRAPAHNGAPGYSWQDLASALGVTRSAAAQRFRQR
jgi:hypothetical protein